MRVRAGGEGPRWGPVFGAGCVADHPVPQLTDSDRDRDCPICRLLPLGASDFHEPLAAAIAWWLA
jgi:hypothetical protein